MPYILDRSLYLDVTKTKVVEENDPAARYVLGVKGSVINDADAKAYGLDKVKGMKREGEQAAPEVEEVKATQPEANKALAAKTNKGA